MNELKCIICKRVLPTEGVVEPVCKRFQCKEKYEYRMSLANRIKDFCAFFTGKNPTEEVYQEYFELVGLEKEYRQYAGTGEVPRATRRMWFWANVISVHAEWPNESSISRKGEN